MIGTRRAPALVDHSSIKTRDLRSVADAGVATARRNSNYVIQKI